jgi:hypothetical protein
VERARRRTGRRQRSRVGRGDRSAKHRPTTLRERHDGPAEGAISPVRLKGQWPPSCPGSAASLAPRPSAGRRRSTSTPSRDCSSRSTPPPWLAGAIRALLFARVRRGAAALGTCRARRRGPDLQRRPRAARHDPRLQDRPGAGRSRRRGAVRARGRLICARSARCAPSAYLEATGIHRGAVFRRLRRGDTLTDQRLTDQSVNCRSGVELTVGGDPAQPPPRTPLDASSGALAPGSAISTGTVIRPSPYGRP